MQNPFDSIQTELNEIKILLKEILSKPSEDLTSKLYTVSEAASILKIDKQTVSNHILKGNIKATKIGRRILLTHSELFNSLNEVKSLKYKRSY
ncbi:helix-turn-helix domain-containing protein [Flavobacterium psychrophilum]|uniref:helix-turn-helix domain-containing protein n=1 Tax=Flavobacterium psychrophilum TaxID=96345 RepID=UPI00193129BA|nr:helix-turn-helix domain-containing protein [Flavobacterium psychrophilum]QRE62094.1 helix-turn-helix domain-containing protein [Flavobacterium psychrophilum]QRE64283.1 helix-turn-helix domain-containing protein [Flavobacterium psychrophilum]